MDAEPLKVTEIARIGIFEGVSSESIWGLLQHCPVMVREPGAIVISPESAGRHMLCILDGSVRVHLSPPPAEAVATLGAGQTVGEINVIDSRSPSAWVIALRATRLLVVDEATFWRLISASHAFSINLLRLLAQRLRVNNEHLTDTVQRSRLFERQASTDSLTGLLNRRWLDDSLPRFLRRTRWGKRPLSVLLLDVDHFKKVNDVHGHLIGDALLAWVAQILIMSLRPTDFAARYGGEEFVVLLPGTSGLDARSVAERLRLAIGSSPLPNTDLNATVSIGIASTDGTDDLAGEALLGSADRCLYRAKSTGRDRVEGPDTEHDSP